MGEITQPKPVLLFAAVTSRYEPAIEWSIRRASAQWGKVALQSSIFDFTETKFYTESMGTELKKQLFVFEDLIAPDELPKQKVLSNEWEEEYNRQSDFPEKRPLNIDPGYVTEAKLVLATTKDRDHRIYLSDGILAEITLHFQSGQWQKSRWTYPDYQRKDFQEFLTKCRIHLRERLRELKQVKDPNGG